MIMKYIISEVAGRGSIVSAGLRFDFDGEDGGVGLPVLRPSGEVERRGSACVKSIGIWLMNA